MYERANEELEALRAVDSPTLSNAIERCLVRPRTEGYASYQLRCAFPELGSMVGFAVTCTADSTTEGRRADDSLLRLWEAVERAPKPTVLVIHDVGPDPTRGCHMGEISSRTSKRYAARAGADGVHPRARLHRRQAQGPALRPLRGGCQGVQGARCQRAGARVRVPTVRCERAMSRWD